MKLFIVFFATLTCAVATPFAYSPAPASYSFYTHYPVADIKVLPNGYLVDTPEVSHAKTAHNVAKAHVAAAAAANPDYDSYSQSNENSYSAPTPYTGAYAHSVADIKVLPSGFLADTPEVTHAKSAHLAEKAKVGSKSTYYTPAPYAAPVYTVPAGNITPNYALFYANSVADIKVLPSGYLADTPEVAHAKVVHSVEKAKAHSAAVASPDHEYTDESYSHAAPAYSHESHAAPAYSHESHAAPAYSHESHAAPAYSHESHAAPAYSHESHAAPAYCHESHAAPAYSHESHDATYSHY